jgi:hypothetical protein
MTTKTKTKRKIRANEMKTLEDILAYKAQCLDGRDLYRLVDYIPAEHWGKLGIQPKEGASIPPAKPLTRENVLASLEADLAFGFEKALNKRGISAGLMYETVKMWLWVLDDELASFEDYAQYGLPLFKAVSVKFGFDNPIGDDVGDEYQYSSDADY